MSKCKICGKPTVEWTGFDFCSNDCEKIGHHCEKCEEYYLFGRRRKKLNDCVLKV